MVDPDDIRPLSEFTRNAKAHVARLRRTGRPEILTVNGKAAVVVQDAKTYKKILDILDRVDVMQKVRAGLRDAEEGRTQPAREALEEIRTKYRNRRRS